MCSTWNTGKNGCSSIQQYNSSIRLATKREKNFHSTVALPIYASLDSCCSITTSGWQKVESRHPRAVLAKRGCWGSPSVGWNNWILLVFTLYASLYTLSGVFNEWEGDLATHSLRIVRTAMPKSERLTNWLTAEMLSLHIIIIIQPSLSSSRYVCDM